MAVEDGAALAEAVHMAANPDQIGKALQVWESVRIERSGQMLQASALNGKLWHFADGAEQEARDAAMKPEVEGRQFMRSPNQWSDPTTQRWCFGYDAETEIRRAWASTKRSQQPNGCDMRVNGDSSKI